MLFLLLCALEKSATINYFVYLKNPNTRVRKGPSSRNPVSCILTTPRYPLKVIASYENWRHIADHKGPVGWVHKTFLAQKKRFGLVTKPCVLTQKDSKRPVASLPEGFIVELVHNMNEQWFVLVRDPTCKNKKMLTGLVPCSAVWGE